MPELPEVESVRRQLDPELAGRRIVEVWRDPHPEQRFSDVEAIVGHRVEKVTRRGKYLICPAAPPVGEPPRDLVLHLGMTGSFRFDRADSYARARFWLDDGRELVFRDPRRFGRVSVVPAGEYASIPTLAALGPEPLSDEFSPEGFAASVAASRAPVKALLLSQRAVAGVGNIYADEALWRARIHPRSRRVGARRAHDLHDAIREVLEEAIAREGTTFRDYQMVNGQSGRNADYLTTYGRAGLPCARCGEELRRTVIAQRGTTYCASCQRY